MSRLPISRRTALKGLGVSLALPLLDGMLPGLGFAKQATPQVFPRRMAFCYVPNGVLYNNWAPTGTGRNFTFSPTLELLKPYRDEVLILSGLTSDKARAHGDGTGDHARAQASFLTGRQAKRTDGSEIRCGISVDQLCAQKVGDRTRFASLEIGCEGGRPTGGCDPGYSCAYTSNLSWRGESTPAPKETNPQSVFDRLFASTDKGEARTARLRREQNNQSILDFVMEDARSLNNHLGGSDQRKVDEYLSSIRDVERRIGAFRTAEPQGPPAMARPDTTPTDYKLHLRIMADLLAIAFQTDVTRISTFVFSNELTNRNYRFIDVSEGHHDISHHQFAPDRMAKVGKIDRFLMEQFVYLVGRLKAMPERSGSVLDNCMILYGSGNGDGARHNHDELPIVMAGKGRGTITPGRHVRYPRNTPICNLYIEMLDRMGVQVESFGDSNGRLRNLS